MGEDELLTEKAGAEDGVIVEERQGNSRGGTGQSNSRGGTGQNEDPQSYSYSVVVHHHHHYRQ